VVAVAVDRQVQLQHPGRVVVVVVVAAWRGGKCLLVVSMN
jgi:hypothetical protein